MANLTGAEMETILLNDLQANVTTDPPLSTLASAGTIAAAQTYGLLFDAAVQIYEAWGGSIKAAASATLWTPAQSSGTTGKATGVLAGISEVLRVWSTATSGSTGASGDNELDRVDLAEIEALRSNSGLGTYTTPVVYCVSQMQTATTADIGKILLDYWPGVTGLYFPAHYIPHLAQLAASTDAYDMPDIAQRDVPHLAAFYGCERINRPDLMGSIAANVSEKTRLLLEERNPNAMLNARQDK